jgi:hypothetical protein
VSACIHHVGPRYAAHAALLIMSVGKCLGLIAVRTHGDVNDETQTEAGQACRAPRTWRCQ